MSASTSRRVLFALATNEALERAVLATPAGRDAAWRVARRYVAGPEVDDALARARALASSGLGASIDLFGERVSDPEEADRVRDAYVALARRLATEAPLGTFLSLDLSHLGVAVDPAGAQGRLEAILAVLPPGVRLQLGAEEAALVDAQLAIASAAAGPARVTVTLQANLRRSPGDADALAAAGLGVRLVKGAYVERARDALPYGEPTDVAYLALARRLAGHGAEVLLGTHHGLLREACLAVLPDAPVEMLLGVRPAEATALVSRGVPVRLYVPCGPAWYRYAARRMAEARGA